MKKVFITIVFLIVILGILYGLQIKNNVTSEDVDSSQQIDKQEQSIGQESDGEDDSDDYGDDDGGFGDEDDEEDNLPDNTTSGSGDASDEDDEGEESSDPSEGEGENKSLETIVKNKERGLSMASYIIFLITLILLLVVSLLLLKEIKWRKRHNKNQSIVFPDAHLDVLDDLKNSWERLYHRIHENINDNVNNQNKSQDAYSEIIDSIFRVNKTIDSQKQEIDRLKEGYDFSIKKNSIIPLLELHDLIHLFLNESTINNETEEKLNKVDGYVLSYLDEMEVERFEIEEGKSIRELTSGEFEIERAEITEKIELHETVKKTIKKGYIHKHPNGKNIIRKAKILIYKMEK
tara:strand:+ start:26 stop:1069 length:1044 start_codon:yes stop_codon:yes gene_type:complete